MGSEFELCQLVLLCDMVLCLTHICQAPLRYMYISVNIPSVQGSRIAPSQVTWTYVALEKPKEKIVHMKLKEFCKILFPDVIYV